MAIIRLKTELIKSHPIDGIDGLDAPIYLSEAAPTVELQEVLAKLVLNGPNAHIFERVQDAKVTKAPVKKDGDLQVNT